MPSVIDAVLKLAAQGYRLVPIEPNGKRCLIKGWPVRATSDPNQLLALWSDQPANSNVGALMGNGQVALDRDDRSGGRESLDRLIAEHGDLPVTTTVKTPGGHHYHFQYADSVRSGPIDGYPGLELRADKALVVLPPSVRPAGAYTWERNGARAALPEWLADLGNRDRIPRKLVDNVEPGGAVEGQRNNALFSYLCGMRAKGAQLTELLAAGHAYNVTRLSPPLARNEVESTARGICRYDPGNARLPLTDAGLAERFALQYGPRVRHVGGKWFVYDGKRWREDKRNQVLVFAKETARLMYVEASNEPDEDRRKAIAKFALQSESASRIRAMLDLARGELPVDPDQLDADLDLVNCLNGTLRLSTRELQPHSPDDLITKIAGAPYDPNAKCPRWDQFQWEISGGDLDVIDFKNRTYGSALGGRTEDQRIVVNWGEGQNGKSKEVIALLAAFGDYGCQTPVETILTKRQSQIPSDLARLQGRRFVASVEADAGRWLSESTVKMLTGGDRVTARYLHQEWFEYTAAFTLVLSSNNRPRIRGTDHGIWRRIRLVPFPIKFEGEKEDKNLEEKLLAETTGILRWLVNGFTAWSEAGAPVPAAIADATAEYRRTEDIVGTFLDDCCERRPDASIQSQPLYDAYVSWCDRQGHKAMSQTAFSINLRDRGEKWEKPAKVKLWLDLELSL